MKLYKCVGDHVAVVPRGGVERKTSAGIITNHGGTRQQDFLEWGEIVAVGEGHRGWKAGTLWPMFSQVGDWILYPKEAARYSGNMKVGSSMSNVKFVQERDSQIVKREGLLYPLYNRIIGQKVVDPKKLVYIEGVGHVDVEMSIDLGNGSSLIAPDLGAEKGAADLIKIKAIFVGFGQRADNANLTPCSVEVGDTFYVNKWDAWEYYLNPENEDDKWVVVDEEQVLAIEVEDEQ